MNVFPFTQVFLYTSYILREQWFFREEGNKQAGKRRSVPDLYPCFGHCRGILLMSQLCQLLVEGKRFHELMCRECTWLCKYHLSESTTGKHKVFCGSRARTDLSHHCSLLYYYFLKKRQNQGQSDRNQNLTSALAWSQGKVIPLQWVYILTLQVHIVEEFVKRHDRKTYKKP